LRIANLFPPLIGRNSATLAKSTFAPKSRYGKKEMAQVSRTRVEQGVGDVHENVGHDHEHGGGQHETDDQRQVALVDRLDRVLADAADAEHGPGHHYAAEQRADVDAELGHHRRERAVL
jgi:hypothetical protein